jgi:putative transposase
MTYYERNLPHWLPKGRAIFLTWRLHGSLPGEVVRQLRKLEKEPGKQFLTADQWLDAAATGPRWLNDPEIAGYAEAAIQRGAELGHYMLRAYVVMPNHVHLLLEPLAPLRRITGGIKGGLGARRQRSAGALGKTFLTG